MAKELTKRTGTPAKGARSLPRRRATTKDRPRPQASVTVVAPPFAYLLNGVSPTAKELGETMRRGPRAPRPLLLSMFTGGGFMDIGFEQAGYDVVWTNEHNPVFAQMYVAARTAMRIAGASRFPPAPNTVSLSDLTATQVARAAFGNKKPPLFGAMGGPPCPDFSRGGLNGGGSGKNGKLTAHFVSLLCELKPTFFVMENVPGLYHTKKHRRFLNRQLAVLRQGGFLVDCKILNALEYGAPQDRERLFVVGFRRRIARDALGEHVPGDAHGWFPWPVDPRYAKARSLEWPVTAPFRGKPRKPQGIPDELTVNAHLGPQNDPGVLPNGTDVFEAHSKKFWERREGDVRHKSFKRLHRYRFSPTAWYGNQEVHLHPWLPRRLSVREALRLQTVPDDYVLPEEFALGAKFKLICNGDPCVMARAIAESVRVFLLQSPLAVDALKRTKLPKRRERNSPRTRTRG